MLHKCALVLYDRWDRNRGIGSVRFDEEYEPTVAFLAYQMFTDARYAVGITESRLVPMATQFLTPSRFASEAEAGTFARALVEHCRDRAWVLTDVGSDELGESIYQFTHQTFREFFCALHVFRSHKIADRLAPALQEPVRNSSWGLVLLLVVQIVSRTLNDEADELVQLLLDAEEGASNAHLESTMRFMVEVLRNVPLSPATVGAIVDRCAELVTAPRSPDESFLDFGLAFRDVRAVNDANRDSFVAACHHWGLL